MRKDILFWVDIDDATIAALVDAGFELNLSYGVREKRPSLDSMHREFETDGTGTLIIRTIPR
jgi:hypothetical protein